MSIKKAILPVAGMGTRFLPITKSVPKEMLPIIDKPILHYLIEELADSGIEEVVMITGRGKGCIEDYFDQNLDLERNLTEKGKKKEAEEIAKIASMVKLAYTRQPQPPQGNGHAIICAENLIGEDEPVVMLFGDDLVVNKENPVTKQMMDLYEEKKCPILCVEEVPEDMISSYGIIDAEKDPSASSGQGAKNVFQVKSMIEKPKREEAPSNLGVIGKYIITPEIIKILKELWDKKEFNKELGITDALRAHLKTGGEIYAIRPDGKRYDTGDKWELLKANIEFALERDDLKDKLKEHLKKLF
ncbi:MAG: UTP--glucose-1-phosphate uridylyltransferase [Patescibacteria group bacterium]|nr:UTP--glucose-1-phosphate uridylyltransferase [Patescibacteria group bacterium]